MAHIDLAEGTGEPRPTLQDGSGYMNIQHTAGSIPARQAFLGGRLFDLIEGGSAETSPVYRRRVKLNMAVAVSERSTWRVGAPSQSPVFPQYHRYIISSLESMRKSSPPQLT